LTIDSLKDLQKLLALCKKQGVTSIKIDGIELTLTLNNEPKRSHIDLDAFPEANIRVPQYTQVSVQDTATEVIEPKIDMPDELTDEQLMFYSAKPEVQ
jgi:hypothetical protein